MSAASEGQRLGTVALGVANLVGVVVLGRLLADPQVCFPPYTCLVSPCPRVNGVLLIVRLRGCVLIATACLAAGAVLASTQFAGICRRLAAAAAGAALPSNLGFFV